MFSNRVDHTPSAVLVALILAVLGSFLGCTAVPGSIGDSPVIGSRVATCRWAPESSENSRRAKPILWQVDLSPHHSGEKAGRLYLLGSIHVGPPDGWQLCPEVMDLFDRADALVVEVDLRGPGAERQDEAVMRYGLLPAGESLKNHLSSETYSQLGAHLEQTKRSLANVNAWRAWMVATMLVSREIERLGYPTDAGLDVDLMRRAGNTKQVLGLETSEEQLSMLGGMSDAHQELMLKDTLNQMPEIATYFEALKSAWQRGDESALTAILFEELESNPELAPFYERVIFDRNKTMGARLRTLTPPGNTYFVVVGANHLVGDRGIPAQFSRLGYTVTRLHFLAPK